MDRIQTVLWFVLDLGFRSVSLGLDLGFSKVLVLLGIGSVFLDKFWSSKDRILLDEYWMIVKRS
jgi:hypothetical protein